MSRIISIGTAVPKYGAKQNTLLNFMNEVYADATMSRKLNVLFRQSGIHTRYSVISDFNDAITGDFFFNEEKSTPTVDLRLKKFREQAIPLAFNAVQNTLEKLAGNPGELKVTHLITVTCTGLYAPGIDTEMIKCLNLSNDVFHIAINFLGCNAAFPALKIADMITKTDENAKVMIVCVELCTLHFQPKRNDDNLLANTIFGDGAAAILITSDSYAKQQKLKGFVINGFYSLLLDHGKDLMGWNINSVNFEMILNSGVSEFIGNAVNEVIIKAFANLNIKSEQINKWAIHPGGKKILDNIKKNLQLTDEDLKYSYKVLAEFGNMSSSTVLFVLNEILNAVPKPNDHILSMGFGPGLNIETALLTYVE